LTISLLILVASAAAIYLCCESFTNGIEWLGHRLKLGQTATGTILAALGTALPEGVVTLMATAFAETPAQKSIGIGAAMGGPMVLATLAYAVTGFVLLSLKRIPRLRAQDQRRLSGNQIAFLGIFIVKLGLGLVAFAGKPWFGCAFLAAYALYLRAEMHHPADASEGELAPLKLRPNSAQPALAWILLQCLAAALVIFLASRFFVDQLDVLAPALGLSPQLVSMFVAPVATELPELLNALIWVRQGKDRLALANISGSMMIQATIPTSFGLFFTPWMLDRALVMAGVATAAAILYLIMLFRRPRVQPILLVQSGWAFIALIAGIIVLG
jgi:cation:H+ antiporter